MPTGLQPDSPKLIRGIGLGSATALNMIDMIGVGPFITMPLVVAAMGGPQALLGWIVGALLAICDGLVWAERGGAMPGSGGSYVYLRQIYGPARLGKLVSFLFIWQLSFSAPLSVASGALGFAKYTAYLLPGLETQYAARQWSLHLPLLGRSEEHTSELQSPDHLVCRLLLEKKTRNSSTLRRRISRHDRKNSNGITYSL